MTQDAQRRASRARRVGRGAIGILADGRRYLMIRRADGIAMGGFWCFPGGHVEPGETPRRAVRRELAEELGLDVLPFERLGSVRVIAGRYVLAVWRIRLVGGTLRLAPDEVAEVGWFTGPQIRTVHPGLPSNQHVLEMLGE